MRTLTMVALALTLTVPGAVAQQASTQSGQEAQRRELREQMRQLQQQMRELEREMARLEPEVRTRTMVTPRAYAGPSLLFGNRARMGVNVASDRNPATDSIGAVLSSVTPSGPADKAGLKAGDIITSFNGEKLAGRYPAAGDEESPAARKLVDFAQELEEGDTVVVDYRRGKETHRATIVAKQLGSEGFTYSFTTPDVKIRAAPVIAEIEALRGALAWSSGWHNVELVKLNPELGDYFGTTDGLLVIRAPEDSELQLKGGDVILSVDGRPASSQAQLMRILRSYEAGEGVKLDVMRQKRRMTLDVKIPEQRTPRPGRDFHWDFER